jgi:biotin carboxylase
MHALLVNSNRVKALAALDAVGPERITVLTERENISAYRGWDERVQSELVIMPIARRTDFGEVLGAVAEAHRRAPVSHVMAATEASMIPAGLVRSMLGLGGPGLDQTLLLADKVRMKARTAAHGIPQALGCAAARWHDVREAARAVGWPVIVKPATAAGGMGVCVASSEHDLPARPPARLGPPTAGWLVERLLALDAEMHCDAVVSRGRVQFASVSRYLTPLHEATGQIVGSCTVDGDDPWRSAVIDLHADVIRAVGLRDGVTHMEALIVDGRLLFGEIAGRPAGAGITELVLHATGVDLWRALAEISVGAEPGLPTARSVRRPAAAIGLPSAPGEVAAMTDVAQLRQIPWVVDAVAHFAVGDRVGGRPTRSSFGATVWIELDDPAQFESRARELEAQWTFVTTGRPSSPGPDVEVSA